MTLRCLLPVLAALAATHSLPAAHVWVEGESGRGERISPNGWYRSVRTEDLSGGAWLASYGGRQPALATYSVKIPQAGNYTLWVRANPVSATLHVGFGNDGEWLPVPITGDPTDTVNIASDGKPDMRFLAWTKVGPVELAAGGTRLKFRMSSGNGNHGAIDCFCLTTDRSWRPSKTRQPGEPSGWPAPVLSDDNVRDWGEFIRPSKDDLAWRGVRWHRHLDEAAAEARKLGRPILLWAMNGHPCGET